MGLGNLSAQGQTDTCPAGLGGEEGNEKVVSVEDTRFFVLDSDLKWRDVVLAKPSPHKIILDRDAIQMVLIYDLIILESGPWALVLCNRAATVSRGLPEADVKTRTMRRSDGNRR